MSYTVQHELKGRAPRPVPWWVVIVILVIAAAALILAALFIGHRIGYAQDKAINTVYLTKTCPAPAQFSAWNCSSSELREYKNVCLRRMKGAHQ